MNLEDWWIWTLISTSFKMKRDYRDGNAEEISGDTVKIMPNFRTYKTLCVEKDLNFFCAGTGIFTLDISHLVNVVCDGYNYKLTERTMHPAI